MEEAILKELQELKELTLLNVKKVLTMNEAAKFIGLSKSHLYKLVCYKHIPYYKSEGGKITYFNKDELTAWMLQNRIKTTNEIESEAADYCTKSKINQRRR